MDPPPSTGSGASGERREHGLALVVGMMGGDHDLAPAFGRDGPQRILTQSPGPRGDVSRPATVDAANLARKAGFAGGGLHHRRLVRRLPTQAMIDVGHHAPHPRRSFSQRRAEPEQRERVEATADREDTGLEPTLFARQ